jgi:hypothetical protein
MPAAELARARPAPANPKDAFVRDVIAAIEAKERGHSKSADELASAAFTKLLYDFPVGGLDRRSDL